MQSTGRLTLITNAVAARVLMQDGKAWELSTSIFSKKDGGTCAKIVMLCAPTLESTRLMLNSGICNSSGVLGMYLMDHIFEGGSERHYAGTGSEVVGGNAAPSERRVHPSFP